jgi:hypothetical protein
MVIPSLARASAFCSSEQGKVGMIACTKLFAIDDVRLVIFNGTLGFINLPFLLAANAVDLRVSPLRAVSS